MYRSSQMLCQTNQSSVIYMSKFPDGRHKPSPFNGKDTLLKVSYKLIDLIWAIIQALSNITCYLHTPLLLPRYITTYGALSSGNADQGASTYVRERQSPGVLSMEAYVNPNIARPQTTAAPIHKHPPPFIPHSTS